jgi:arginase
MAVRLQSEVVVMKQTAEGSSTRASVERREVTIIGAVSNIGIRPYDDGREARHLDRAPGVLRDLGLVARIGAHDIGDVTPAAYRDFRRPPRGVRNEQALVEYSRSLADRVAHGVGDGSLALVLGGDCSIVLGNLLGATRRAPRIGLAYIDAHADFATPEESLTGSAASMCLALAVGRGDSPLARLAGPKPLVRADDVVLIGRRDVNEPGYGHAALAVSGVLDIPDTALQATGGAAVASAALQRIGRTELDGFWIHVDADVLDPRVMPAVDSPEPGGPDIEELAALVRPLVEHPRALGLELTIYDPALDPDRECAARVIEFLDLILGDGGSTGMPGSDA